MVEEVFYSGYILNMKETWTGKQRATILFNFPVSSDNFLQWHAMLQVSSQWTGPLSPFMSCYPKPKCILTPPITQNDSWPWQDVQKQSLYGLQDLPTNQNTYRIHGRVTDALHNTETLTLLDNHAHSIND